ncbi:hypothetical protein [Halocella sp. SP3-1]|uniref:hypothetical protein n=1 Tax=Halocella sp. SP3-1 TaxID=2382161 RepID=UPI000F762FC9|nr:hypothetical protein [Halocella sp. SP3-1]AZO95863.1 hypothetical protein D7D81_15400 [Halocella sp. SP3-1]
MVVKEIHYDYEENLSLDYIRSFISIILIVFIILNNCFGLVISAAYAQEIITDGNTATDVSVDGNITKITTSTISDQNAFNSFDKFSIDSGNIVNMYLPGGTSNLINLVHADKSYIYGMLNSIKNGEIGGNLYFLNPHGIMVGEGATINVGSLTAVTPTHDFMDGFFESKFSPSAEAVAELMAGNIPLNANGTISIDGDINAIRDINLSSGNFNNTGVVNSAAVFSGVETDFSDIVNINNIESGSEIEVNENGNIEIVAVNDADNSGIIASEGDDSLAGGNINISAGSINMNDGSWVSVRGYNPGDILIKAVQSNGGTASINLNNAYLTGNNITLDASSELINSSLFGVVSDQTIAEINVNSTDIEAAGNLFLSSKTYLKSSVTTPDLQNITTADAAVAISNLTSNALVKIGGTVDAQSTLNVGGNLELSAENDVIVNSLADASGSNTNKLGAAVAVSNIDTQTKAQISSNVNINNNPDTVMIKAFSNNNINTTAIASSQGVDQDGAPIGETSKAEEKLTEYQDEASTSEGSVNVAAAVAISDINNETEASISGDTSTDVTGKVSIISNSINDSNVTADGSTVNGGDTAIGAAVGVNVVDSSNKAVSDRKLNAGAVEVTAGMNDYSAVGAPQTTSNFSTNVTSGAAGGNLGIAGGLAVNVIDQTSHALVQNNLKLNNGDLIINAVNNTEQIATSLPVEDNTSGDSVGVGAAVAINIAKNNQALAKIATGAAITDGNKISLNASGTHLVETTAEAGVAGGTAITPVVALSVIKNSSIAEISDNSQALDITGDLIINAKNSSEVLTTAIGSTEGETTAIGASIAATLLEDNTEASLARNVAGSNNVNITAENQSMSESSSSASASGGKGEENGAPADGEDVNQKIDDELSYGQDKQGKTEVEKTEAASAETSEGTVSVAAAISANMADSNATAKITDGTDLTALGDLSLNSKIQTDAAAIADGSAVDSTTKVGVGAAVALNKVNSNNSTYLGNGIFNIGSLTLQSQMSVISPEKTGDDPDEVNEFVAEATSGAGAANVGIAGGLAVNLINNNSMAKIGQASTVNIINNDTVSGNLILDTENNSSSTARALPAGDGVSADSVGIGASVAMNIVNNNTLAQVLDGAVITGVNNVGLNVTGNHEIGTMAEAGAAGRTAVTPVVALTVADNKTTASLGTSASTLSLAGNLNLTADNQGVSITEAKGNTEGSNVAIGASLAVSVVDDRAEATTDRDINAGGSVTLKAENAGSSSSTAEASAKGGAEDDGTSTIDSKVAEQTDYGQTKQGKTDAEKTDAGSAETSEGAVSVAAAVASNTAESTAKASVNDGVNITSGGELTVSAANNTDAAAAATGSAVDSTTNVGVGAAVAVNKATSTNTAYLGNGTHEVNGLTVEAIMNNTGTDTEPEKTGVFTAEATSGAGAGNVGVAGSLGLNLIDNSSQALVNSGASTTLNNNDLNLRAENNSISIAAALPDGDGATGDSVGVGASVAMNIVNNSALAQVLDGAVIIDAGNVEISASGNHEIETVAEAGAAGGIATTPVVALSTVDNISTASLGIGDLLSMTGNLNVTADNQGSVTTEAIGNTEGNVAVGASAAVTVVNDRAEVTTDRDINAGGSVTLKAENAGSSSSTAEASAEGAEKEEGNDVNSKVTELTDFGQDKQGKTDAEKTDAGSAETSEGKVSVAAAVASNNAKSTANAFVNNGVDITSGGKLTVSAANNTDAAATAIGSTVNSEIGVGAAVAVNNADSTNYAYLGNGTHEVNGLTVEAIMNNTGTDTEPEKTSVFTAEASSGAGASNVGVAGSLGLNLIDNSSQALVNSGANIDLASNENGVDVYHDLNITAENRSTSIAKALPEEAGASGDGVGVGASVAINTLTESTIASYSNPVPVSNLLGGDVLGEDIVLDDGTVLKTGTVLTAGQITDIKATGINSLQIRPDNTKGIVGVKNLNIAAHSRSITETRAKAGAQGGVAVDAVVALATLQQTTQATIGAGSEITSSGDINLNASNIGDNLARAIGDTESGNVGVGASAAVILSNSSLNAGNRVDSGTSLVKATIARDIDAGGSIGISAEADRRYEAVAEAGAGGAKSEDELAADSSNTSTQTLKQNKDSQKGTDKAVEDGGDSTAKPGTLSAAAAVGLSYINDDVKAGIIGGSVNNPRSVTAGGDIDIRASNLSNFSSKGSGKAVGSIDGLSKVGIGVGVGISVTRNNTTAMIGSNSMINQAGDITLNTISRQNTNDRELEYITDLEPGEVLADDINSNGINLTAGTVLTAADISNLKTAGVYSLYLKTSKNLKSVQDLEAGQVVAETVGMNGVRLDQEIALTTDNIASWQTDNNIGGFDIKTVDIKVTKNTTDLAAGDVVADDFSSGEISFKAGTELTAEDITALQDAGISSLKIREEKQASDLAAGDTIDGVYLENLTTGAELTEQEIMVLQDKGESGNIYVESSNQFAAEGIAGAGALKVGVAGSLAVTDSENISQAYLGNNMTTSQTAGDIGAIKINVDNTSRLANKAWSAAFGGMVGVGASIATLSSDNRYRAYVGENSDLNTASLTIQALNNKVSGEVPFEYNGFDSLDLRALMGENNYYTEAVAGSGGGSVAVTGSFAINTIKDETTSIVKSGTEITTTGKVKLESSNDTTSKSATGSVAASQSTGVGLASANYLNQTITSSLIETGSRITGSSQVNVSAEGRQEVAVFGISAAAASTAGISGVATTLNSDSRVTAAVKDDITTRGNVDISAYNEIDEINIAGGAAGGGSAGVGAAVNINNINNQTRAYLGQNLVVYDTANINIKADSIEKLETMAVGGAVGGTFAGAGSDLNNEVKGITEAYIGQGSVVNAANNISVLASDTTTVDSDTGSLAIAGSVALGGSYSSLNVGNTVKSYLGDDVIIDTDGNLSIDAVSNNKIEASSLGGGAGVGIAGLGATYLKIEDKTLTTAYLGNQTEIKSADEVNITADSDWTGLDSNEQVVAEALGAGAGIYAGIGAAVADIIVKGQTKAYLNNNVKIGQTAGKSVEKLSVEADSKRGVKTHTMAGAGGIGAGAGSLATTEIVENTAEVQGYKTEAYVGSNAQITTSGDIAVRAVDMIDADAVADAISVGGVAVGVSQATVNLNPTVNSSLGTGGNYTADNLLVQAIEALPDDGTSAYADAKAAGGGLLAANATSSKVMNKSKIVATLGGLDINGIGTELNINSDLRLAATNASRGQAVVSGIQAGIIAAGANLAEVTANSITTAVLQDGTSGNIDGTLTIDATGDEELYSEAKSGSAGGVTGAAATAKTNSTSQTTAELNGASSTNPLKANSIVLDADHTTTFNGKSNSVNAAVIGGSGAVVEHNIDSTVNTIISDGVNLETYDLDVQARNISRKPWLVSDDGSKEFNAEAGSGGLLNGTASSSISDIKHISQVIIGDNSDINIVGDRENSGGTNFRAVNDIEARDKTKLDAGGSINIARSESQIRVNQSDAKVIMGNGADIDTVGPVNMSALTMADIEVNTSSKTYGYAGAAQGKTRSEINTDNLVSIGSNADIRSDGDINLFAGRDADGQRNNIKSVARTDLFNKTALPIETDPIADAIINQDNQINILTGSQLRSAEDISLLTDKGATMADGQGTGKDLYRQLAENVANGFKKIVGGEEVSLEIKGGSSSDDASTAVTVDGLIRAGLRNKLYLEFDGAGNVVNQSDGVNYYLTDENLVSNMFDRLEELKKLRIAYYSDQDARAAYDAEISFLEQRMLRMGYAAKDEATNDIYPSKNVPVSFINVEDIKARGGNINITADNLTGSGALKAPSDTEISIINNSDKFLRVNKLTISDKGGHVYFNEAAVIASTDIKNSNLDSGKAVGINVEAAGSSAVTPKIRVGNTYNPLDNNPAPNIEVVGDITNFTGEVNISNEAGSINIKGMDGKTAPNIVANTVNLSAGQDISQSYVDGFQHIGGDPKSRWATISDGFPFDYSHNELPASAGSLIAGNNVYLSARYLNINGKIQSGIPDWEVTLENLEGQIDNYRSQWYQDGRPNMSDPGNLLKYQLSGFSGDPTGRIKAYYNPETDRIVLDGVKVQGGYVELYGEILNTGGSNGQIDVMDGYGRINVTNNTQYDLVINGLDTGNDIAGLIRITDTAKRYNINGEDVPITTEYERINGTVRQRTLAKYDQDNDGVSEEYLIGNSWGTARQSSYQPEEGLRYVWTRGQDGSKYKIGTSWDDSYLGFIDGAEGDYDKWEEKMDDTIVDLPGGEYTDTLGQDSYYQYRYDRYETGDFSLVDHDTWEESTWWGKKTYYVRDTYKQDISDVYTHSLKADHTIGINFIGHDQGEVNVSSPNADVILDNSVSNTGGNVNISTTSGSITQSSERSIITGQNINLSATDGIGSDLQSVAVNLDGNSGSLTAETNQNNINISSISGELRINNIATGQGNVKLSAEGNIVQAASGNSAVVTGNRLELFSETGSIGTDSQALNVQIGTDELAGLKATANNNISVRQVQGDFRLISVESLGGDVSLEAENGTLIDGNTNETRDERTIDQLENLWDDMLLTGTDADQSAQKTITAYRQSKEQDYQKYWQMRNLKAELDENGNIKYDTEGNIIYQYDAYDPNKYIDETKQAEYDQLHQQFKETTYSSEWAYTLTDAERNDLTQGYSWTKGQLESSLSRGILFKQTTSTDTSIEEANIIGHNVTLLANSGSVGTDEGRLVIDGNIGTLTETERLALAAAEADDVGVDNTNNLITVLKRESVDVDATGEIKVEAQDHVYLGSESPLYVKTVNSEGSIRIKGKDGLYNVATAGQAAIQGGRTILEGGNGGIGTEINPLTTDLNADAELTARASQIYLNELNGNLNIAEIYAKNDVFLNTAGSILDKSGLRPQALEGGNIDLAALTGTIGTTLNPLVVTVGTSGQLNASTITTGKGIYLSSDANVFNLGQIDSGGNLRADANHGLIRVRDNIITDDEIELTALTDLEFDFTGSLESNSFVDLSANIITMIDGSLVKGGTAGITLNSDNTVQLSKLQSSGDISVTAGTNIIQTANGAISAGTLSTNSAGQQLLTGNNTVKNFTAVNSGSGQIELHNEEVLTINDIDQTTAGGNVIIDNIGAVEINGEIKTADGLNLISTSSITETETGRIVDALLLSTNSAGQQLLTGNNTVKNFTAVNSGPGKVVLNNTISQLEVAGVENKAGIEISNNGNLLTTGLLTTDTGTIMLDASNGELKISDIINNTTGDITTISTGNTIIDSMLTTPGTVRLTAGGQITETINGQVNNASVLSTNSAGQQMLTGNNTVKNFTAVNSGSGQIELHNEEVLTINDIDQTTAGGNVIIDNIGAVEINGEIKTADELNLISTSSITETETGRIVDALLLSTNSAGQQLLTGNNTVKNFTAVNSGTGKVVLNNTISQLEVAGVENKADIEISNNGNLLTTGLLTTDTGTIMLDASNGELKISDIINNTTGDITTISTGNTIIDSMLTTPGTVRLTVGGQITETINGQVNNASVLSTNSAGQQLLTGNNTVKNFTAVNSGSGQIELHNEEVLTINDIDQTTAGGNVIIDNIGAVEINGEIKTADGLNLSSTSSITETETGRIVDALLLSTNSAGQQLLTGNNTVKNFTAVNSGPGKVVLNNTISQLEVAGVENKAGIEISNNGNLLTTGLLTTDTGTIMLDASNGELKISDIINNTTGDITTISTGNTIIDSMLTTPGTVRLTAGGQITETINGQVNNASVLSTNSAGQQMLTGNNTVKNFTAVNSGTGKVVLNNTISQLEVAGVENKAGIEISNNGNLLTTGLLTTDTGTIMLDASNGELKISDIINNTTGDITTISSGNTIIDSMLTTPGTVRLTAGGQITETINGQVNNASVLSTNSAGQQMLTGNNTVKNFTAVNSGSGQIELHNEEVLTINDIDQKTAGGNVVIDNVGAVEINGEIKTADEVNLSSSSNITETETGRIVNASVLSTNSAGQQLLTGNNTVKNFTAVNSGPGKVVLNNTISQLEVAGVENKAGIEISNNGNLLTTGLLTTDTGTIMLDASNGELKITDIINNTTGDITTISSGNTIIDSMLTTPGTVRLTAGGQITETINGQVSMAAALSTNSAGQQLLTGNNTVKSFTAVNSGSGQIELHNEEVLTINDIDQKTAGGNVIIDNVGAVEINGEIKTADEVNLSSSSSITETETGRIVNASLLSTNSADKQLLTGNNTVKNFTAVNSGSGQIELHNEEVLTINDIDQKTAGGNVIIDNVGAVGINGEIKTADEVNLSSSSSITETETGRIVNASLLSTNSVDKQLLTGNNTVKSFTAVNSGSGQIELHNEEVLTINDIDQKTAGGNVIIDNVGAVEINGEIKTADEVNLSSSSSITETGTGRIVNASVLSTDSVAGQLLNGNNKFESFTAVNSANGNIELYNNESLFISNISQLAKADVVVNNSHDVIVNKIKAVEGSTVLNANGSILSADDESISSNIAAINIGLTAQSGTIGQESNYFKIDSSNSQDGSVAVTAEQGIYLEEVMGDLNVDQIRARGDIYIIAEQSILNQNTNDEVNFEGENVDLVAANGSIGEFGNRVVAGSAGKLDMYAYQGIHLEMASGDVFLKYDGDLVSDLIEAENGSIDLYVPEGDITVKKIMSPEIVLLETSGNVLLGRLDASVFESLLYSVDTDLNVDEAYVARKVNTKADNQFFRKLVHSGPEDINISINGGSKTMANNVQIETYSDNDIIFDELNADIARINGHVDNMRFLDNIIGTKAKINNDYYSVMVDNIRKTLYDSDLQLYPEGKPFYLHLRGDRKMLTDAYIVNYDPDFIQNEFSTENSITRITEKMAPIIGEKSIVSNGYYNYPEPVYYLIDTDGNLVIGVEYNEDDID